MGAVALIISLNVLPVLLYSFVYIIININADSMNNFKWKRSYSLKAVLTIPSANLSVPYQMWVNGDTRRSRVDFYGGLNKLYRQWNGFNKTYEYFKIHPDTTGKTDKVVCHKMSSSAPEITMYDLNTFLPDKQWKYVCAENMNNIKSQKYTYESEQKQTEKYSVLKNVYTVWVTFKEVTGTHIAVPVRFVYEELYENRSINYFRHDYSYFDDSTPDFQTLLMPLGMRCIHLENERTELHEFVDIESKYIDQTSMNSKTRNYNEWKYKIDASANTFQWSKSYTLKAILTVPAANITEPYQVWLDGDTGKSRVDFYHGMDKLYREFDTQNQAYKFFKIHPVTNNKMESKEVCNEVDSTAPEVKMYALNTYLPVKRWTYIGDEFLNNAEAKKFVYEYPVKINQKESGKVVYSVWVNNKGVTAIPVRFVYELRGESKVLDNFRHDYTYFDGSKPDSSVLEKPANMKCRPLKVDTSHESIDPLVEYIEPILEHSRVEKAFEWFKTKHNKIYTNKNEHFKRMYIFKDNLRFINSFNRQHRSFTVGVNHLADLSKEEIFYGILNKHTDDNDKEGSGDSDNNNLDDDDLNEILTGSQANFDWRSYGAVSPVKDQTTICGSCYAFTTAAAVESSAYVARGCKDLEEVSEQAIIDCTWGVDTAGNLGCSGGLYEYALQWVNKFGIPFRTEYGPYLAMEGRCHAMKMKNFMKIDSYKGLEKKKRVIRDTLRSNGPLLASIDANHLSFTFYASGVYDEPECSNDPNQRSHGVTIVGYGRENGEDHWTLKNSFGKDWGEDGYMRLAQAKNRCGLKNFVYSVNFENNKSSECPIKP